MAYSKNNVIHGSPLPKYILDSKSNLSQHLIQTISEHGNKTALIDAHNEMKFTFENILNASLNIASCLKYEYGIQKSDVVGVFSENTIWYPSVILAIWHIGAICTLLNPMYTFKELEHALNITEPKMLITSKMNLNVARDTVKNLTYVKYVCPIDALCNSRMIQINNTFVPTPYDNNQTCMILFSSGTTGLPKGVELSHKSIFLLIYILNSDNKLISSNDIVMGLVPMFHGYGVLVLWLCMSMGTKIVVLKFFKEELFLKSIEVQKITILFLVPPLMVFLAKNTSLNKYNLSYVNIIFSGASPLSKDIENEVIMKVGKGKDIKVLQGYGMTEISILGMMYKNIKTAEIVPGSVGRLISGMSVKVIDIETGKALGINQSGELCFKGPMVMKSYYRNTKETLETIDTEGWLHTGDIGYYDKNYNFFIIDRIKELIKYKGYQVSPAEIEKLLLTHPEIEDAAVIGIPNEEAGELPFAFVVKSSNSNLNEKDVIHFVHNQVSVHKRLRGGVQFVNNIPKNASGKILRRYLRDLLNKSKL